MSGPGLKYVLLVSMRNCMLCDIEGDVVALSMCHWWNSMPHFE